MALGGELAPAGAEKAVILHGHHRRGRAGGQLQEGRVHEVVDVDEIRGEVFQGRGQAAAGRLLTPRAKAPPGQALDPEPGADQLTLVRGQGAVVETHRQQGLVAALLGLEQADEVALGPAPGRQALV